METKKYFNEDGELILPQNIVELRELADELWEEIFSEEKENKEKIKTYNQAASLCNRLAGRDDLTVIKNFKQLKEEQIMATKKAAAKKAATKKSAPKKGAAKKSAPAKKAAAKKEKGAPSQKDQIVMLADQGLDVDQIVEKTGIKKANVQWYFSKLKLGKKKK